MLRFFNVTFFTLRFLIFLLVQEKLKGMVAVFKVCNYRSYDYNTDVSNQPTKVLIVVADIPEVRGVAFEQRRKTPML